MEVVIFIFLWRLSEKNFSVALRAQIRIMVSFTIGLLLSGPSGPNYGGRSNDACVWIGRHRFRKWISVIYRTPSFGVSIMKASRSRPCRKSDIHVVSCRCEPNYDGWRDDAFLWSGNRKGRMRTCGFLWLSTKTGIPSRNVSTENSDR